MFSKFCNVFLIGMVLLGAWEGKAVAQSLGSREVRNANGDVVFIAEFYAPNDGNFDGADTASTWTLDDRHMDAVERAMNYWAERINPANASELPVTIRVGTYNAANASCGARNRQIIDGQSVGGMEVVLVDGESAPGAYQAVIYIGTLDFTFDDNRQINSNNRNMETIIIHEIGHGLGISGGNAPNRWTARLQGDRTDGNPRVFTGPEAVAVYGGAVPMNPRPPRDPGTNGPDDPGYSIGNADGHFGIKNALLTHEGYRNYSGFMEVEIAALQDIGDVGYDIDRRNFFGRSIYTDGDGITPIENNQGFFARNTAGNAYIENQENLASYGLGLHIFGNNNHVIQNANILANGTAGCGIRSDGNQNTIVINPDILISANGSRGVGLLVAYGNGTSIVHQGILEGTGTDGIGACFDLGGNVVGDPRSSYQAGINDLNGALVNQFDISGLISGSKAAIYIADNAHVEQINFMNPNGILAISGDIISDYNVTDGSGNLRTTTLTFGKTANANGVATSNGDSDFVFTYTGNITGEGAFDLETWGKETTLSGTTLKFNDGTIGADATGTKSTLNLPGTVKFSKLNLGSATNTASVLDGKGTGQISVTTNGNGVTNRITVQNLAKLEVPFIDNYNTIQGNTSIVTDDVFLDTDLEWVSIKNRATGQFLNNTRIEANDGLRNLGLFENNGTIIAGTFIDNQAGAKIDKTTTLLKTGTDLINAGTISETAQMEVGTNLTNNATGLIYDTGKMTVGSKINNAGLIDTAMLVEATGNIENTGLIQKVNTLETKSDLNNSAVGRIFNNTTVKAAGKIDNAGLIDTATLVEATGNIENKNTIQNIVTLHAKTNLINQTGGQIVNNQTVQADQDVINDGTIDNFQTLQVGRNVVNETNGYINVLQTSTAKVGNNVNNTGHIKANGVINVENRFNNQLGGLVTGTGLIAANGGFINEGVIAPGNSIGTLTEAGTFTNNGGAFDIEIDPSHYPNQPVAGVHNDLVKVIDNLATAAKDGNAIINGGTVLVAAPSNDKTVNPNPVRYVGNTKYTFLTTEDGLEVNTKLIANDPVDLLLFDFVADYDNKDYWLEIQREYFYGPFGDTYNQISVGNYIDEIGLDPDPNGDFFGVLVALDQLNKNAGISHRTGISNAARFSLDQMSGAIYGTLGTAGITNTILVNNTLSDVLRRDAFADPCCQNVCGRTDVKRNAWGLAYGMDGRTQFDGNAYGYDQTFGGTLIGIDRNLHQQARWGIFASYGEGRISSSLIEKTKSKEFLGGIYFRKQMRVGYFLASGGLGNNRYETQRTISFVNRRATNKHDAFVGTVSVERGLEYKNRYGKLQPFLGLQYAANQQEGFTEKGAGSLNLIGDTTTAHSLRSSFGSRFELNSATVNQGKLSPYGSALWMHEFLSRTNTNFTGQFSNPGMSNFSSTAKYTVKGNSPNRDWAVVGAGLNYERNRLRLFAGYDAYVNDQQTLHTGNAGLAYLW